VHVLVAAATTVSVGRRPPRRTVFADEQSFPFLVDHLSLDERSLAGD
jgi:hypothetical protein